MCQKQKEKIRNKKIAKTLQGVIVIFCFPQKKKEEI